MFKAISRVRHHKKFKSVILPGNRVVCNVPVRYRYIAVESDGGVFAFVTKPFVKTEYEGFTQITEYWTTRKNRDGDCYHLGDIRFTGDWRDSLMKIEGNFSTAIPVKQMFKSTKCMGPGSESAYLYGTFYTIPKSMGWAAVNKNGEMYCHKKRPRKSRNGDTWVGGGTRYYIGVSCYTGEWTDSLIKLED